MILLVLDENVRIFNSLYIKATQIKRDESDSQSLTELYLVYFYK